MAVISKLHWKIYRYEWQGISKFHSKPVCILFYPCLYLVLTMFVSFILMFASFPTHVCILFYPCLYILYSCLHLFLPMFVSFVPMFVSCSTHVCILFYPCLYLVLPMFVSFIPMFVSFIPMFVSFLPVTVYIVFVALSWWSFLKSFAA